MKIAIPTISNDDLDIANSAMIGAETIVSISYTDVALVGTMTQGADLGSSELDLEGAYQPPSGTDGRDLQLVCDNGCLSGEEIIITFDITMEGSGTPVGTAIGHFIIPEYAQNDTFNLPIGLAVDLTVQGSGNSAKKIRTITGIHAIAGGRAGNRYKVINVPDDFVAVACAIDKNPTLPSQKAIAIPCGYNGARWVKKGRSDAPTLEVSAKYTSYGDGLLRLNGHRATVMLEAVKDDRLLTERAIFGGWRPTITPRHGDGDTEDEARATGIYESLAVAV